MHHHTILFGASSHMGIAFTNGLAISATKYKCKKKTPKYASKIQTLGTSTTQYFQPTHEAKNNPFS